jgi:hypothetical protein
VGLWVAEEFLKLTGDEAGNFAGEVVASDFEKPGDDDVIEFVMSKIKDAGADLTETRLRHQMDEMLKVSLEELNVE